MKRWKWSELPPEERAELEALRKSKSPAYLLDYDWVPLPVSGLLLGIAGVVALWIESDGRIFEALSYVPELVREMGFFGALPALRTPGMFAAALTFTLWMAYLIVSFAGHRGSAATSFASIKVLGRRKLKLMRHADVAKIERRVLRTKKTSFTVFELYDRAGKKLTFLVHGTWADAATAAIEKGRS